MLTFLPAAFSVTFFPATFHPVVIPLFDFPFVTSALTSFLPFIFPHATCTSLLSCPIVTPSFSTVTFFHVTFLHVKFSGVLSQFVFLEIKITLHPLSLLSSSVLSLHCTFRPLYHLSIILRLQLLCLLFYLSYILSNNQICSILLINLLKARLPYYHPPTVLIMLKNTVN